MKAVGPRRGALLGLVLLVALFGAGCGGGDDDGDQAGDQQGTGGAAQLENPITPGRLTVGTELPAPPFWIGDDYDSIS